METNKHAKLFLGDSHLPIEKKLEAAIHAKLVQRIWDKDASLWTNHEQEPLTIMDRLGWLDAINHFSKLIDEITLFSEKIIQQNYQHAVLLGMGGSSLCPDVLQRMFTKNKNALDLQVLDTTDPETIRLLQNRINIHRTLFIVSSKSGSTIEIDSLYKYFYKQCNNNGSQFIAITDPNTPLHQLGVDRNFERVFLNPKDIGGRFSALSYFGLVPAALMGIDIKKLLSSANQMMLDCKNTSATQNNPGLLLGVFLATLAAQKKDKMTLVGSKELMPFFDWVEQLVAESTGKEGKGILPIVDEPLSSPDMYHHDRMFVVLEKMWGNKSDEDFSNSLSAISKQNHPMYQMSLQEPYDIGGQFFLWEFATAVAGSLLGVNPFDEPNVRQSKEITKELLQYYKNNHSLPLSTTKKMNFEEIIKKLSKIQPQEYVALLAYLPYTKENHSTLTELRTMIRTQFHVATTLGYGPRFLHSTGQYHKGGPKNGHFIQFICEDKELEIPGENYGFSILKQAQAQGDIQALQSCNQQTYLVLWGQARL